VLAPNRKGNRRSIYSSSGCLHKSIARRSVMQGSPRLARSPFTLARGFTVLVGEPCFPIRKGTRLPSRTAACLFRFEWLIRNACKFSTNILEFEGLQGPNLILKTWAWLISPKRGLTRDRRERIACCHPGSMHRSRLHRPVVIC